VFFFLLILILAAIVAFLNSLSASFWRFFSSVLRALIAVKDLPLYSDLQECSLFLS
jgi:hypothetical protein